jgi:hypothetical protein
MTSDGASSLLMPGRVLPADHAAARPRAIKERDERTARI